MIRALGIGLVLAALVGGCSERPRLNPLDPENVETGGRLTSLQALAGDSQVELRWDRLTQTGVLGYAVQRWIPGRAPVSLFDADLPPGYSGTVDTTAQNDTTYVYRLVAHLETGDSAVSPADTATPGTRKIVALSAGLPGLVGLTADARELLYESPSGTLYGAIALDKVHQVVWLTLPDDGRVERRAFNSLTVGPSLYLPDPADVSVSNLRGVGWVVSPTIEQARSYGPLLTDENPATTIASVGPVRAVRAGTLDPSVWLGNASGVVRKFSTGGVLQGTWSLGSPVVTMALDEEAGRAWVACGANGADALYMIDPADSSVALKQSGLRNVVSLVFTPANRSLWISQRGDPQARNGALVRASDEGAPLMTLSGLEPFGLAVDPGGANCWVSDLASGRLLLLAPDGTVLLRSAPIDKPYGVALLDSGPGP
jgi:hypothetical protein